MARNVERQKQSSKRKSSPKTNTSIKGSSHDKQSTAFITEAKEPVTPRNQAGRTRKASGEASKARSKNPLKRAASAVGRAVAKLTGRGGKSAKASTPLQQTTDHDAQPATRRKASGQTAARAPRRETDIPMDQLDTTYTPMQTSLKGPFRATGADHQRDQEFATGTGRNRWNDEDRLTNKSGDPRIGTHNRTYEPGEGRAAASDVDYENE
ncbi:MAG TPA: hypothetical protein VN605_02450 [Thermoanaerobaculia bacterium]|nr:hypothetical protein [Thermoanaerobaculia bacterium]